MNLHVPASKKQLSQNIFLSRPKIYVKSAGGWNWAWSHIQWGSNIPSLHLLDKQVFFLGSPSDI